MGKHAVEAILAVHFSTNFKITAKPANDFTKYQMHQVGFSHCTQLRWRNLRDIPLVPILCRVRKLWHLVNKARIGNSQVAQAAGALDCIGTNEDSPCETRILQSR